MSYVVVVLVVCFQSLTLTDAQLKYFNTGRLMSLYLLSTNATSFPVNFLPHTIRFKIWDSFASLLMVSHDVHISVLLSVWYHSILCISEILSVSIVF